jgi:hypothetical protein
VTWHLKVRIMEPEETALATLRLFKYVTTAKKYVRKKIVEANADSQTAKRSHKAPFFAK